jgi:hypothetical protein
MEHLSSYRFLKGLEGINTSEVAMLTLLSFCHRFHKDPYHIFAVKFERFFELNLWSMANFQLFCLVHERNLSLCTTTEVTYIRGATTLSIKTLSITTFSLTTLSIMTFSLTRLRIMTFSIATLRITFK